jgi:hypothetical protein
VRRRGRAADVRGIGYDERMGHRRASAALSSLASIALALAACGRDPAPRALPPDEAARLLIDRNWLDVWPRTEEERLHVLRFTPAMGGGVYQDRTLFAGSFELFVFSIGDGELELVLPHTKERVTARYSIERVDGPAPFDLRLTLDPSPRGPSVYHARSAETADEAARTFAPAQPPR